VAPDDTPAGFLSRWSRRKAEARSAPAAPDAAAAGVPAGPAAAGQPPGAPDAAVPPASPVETAAIPPAVPLPTLDDVARLVRDSDYAPFVARGVDPGVRNAALRKLFTDPQFNVMDGLDTYIDDYGKPDPLPAGMLRQMAQAHALGLFDDEAPPDAAGATPAAIPDPGAPLPPPESAPDEDPDLRLQPDDAAGCQGPGPGAGEDAEGEP